MKYLDLIGTELKNDILSDLFETYDAEVVYEYDRTHEGLPDEYRTEIPELGLQFVFDEKQIFKTLFITQSKTNTFNPFDTEDERLKIFSSKSKAANYARENGIEVTEGKADFMGEEMDWIRFEHGSYSIHYEYKNTQLNLVTIQTKIA